jgi:L-iditol 2-dehydrogenase
MKAARLHGPGDVRIDQEPAPEPGPGDAVVRVGAVGICGSDLHWFGEGGIGDSSLTAPLVLGHEIAGTVEGGPLDGRVVAVDPAVPCGTCDTCRRDMRHLCPEVRFAGHGAVDGGMRELMAWPAALLRPLPPALTAEDGALLEPLGVAIHAVDLAKLQAGATVAVVGCGPIGLMIVQVARHRGAAVVVAVDPLPHRRELARRLGADAAAAPDEPLAGLDVAAAFDVVGSAAAVEIAVGAARPGGRVVLVGIPDDDRTTFPAALARRKGLTLLVSRRMAEVYPRAIDLVAHGAVDVRSIVSHRYALDAAADAFETAARRRGHKVLVEPNLELVSNQI